MDAQDGTADAATEEAPKESGCDCAVDGDSPPALLMVFLALALLLRRRRR